MRALFLLLALAAVPAVAQPAVPPAPAAVSPATDAAVDRLLAAMGGRERWAAATGYLTTGLLVVEGEKAPRETTLWVRFDTPQTRSEARAPGSLRVTLLDGDRVVRRLDGVTGNADRATVAGEVLWWQGNLYRNLARLAKRDPALVVTLAGNRLTLSEAGDTLLWIRLSAEGRPAAFGNALNEEGSELGPLVAQGDVRVPEFVRRNGGLWRQQMRSFALNPDFSGVSFTTP
ncbi:hypothetical protein [Sandaracinobacteroides saxicola]|uniref:Outer membrane lipoprotein carrier protein LolA n=1 Tax=Sandaracinobacteroides saxicola TaxID=2759707 RepID=A0A7G5II49_9SPHN|nr:hypothetical protein [Sandaracinobacteroides saxicola]QMW23041.1 hypothetical protein H3309_00550 [Sandaracinobacteroides saxicola]